MSRNFNLKAIHWNEPRVALRAILGFLLVANLATAVVAFKPFGGSAEDLRRTGRADPGQGPERKGRAEGDEEGDDDRGRDEDAPATRHQRLPSQCVGSMAVPPWASSK